MSDNIAGKVVIITGASSGMGEAAARHLAAQGARVVVAARRAERIETLVAEISRDGGQSIAVATDVTKQEDMRKLADLAVERFGRIDVLVNNAGVMPLSPIDRLKVDEWDRMIDVNLRGVLYGIAAVLNGRRFRESGPRGGPCGRRHWPKQRRSVQGARQVKRPTRRHRGRHETRRRAGRGPRGRRPIRPHRCARQQCGQPGSVDIARIRLRRPPARPDISNAE